MKKSLLLTAALAAACSAFAAVPSLQKADKQAFSVGPKVPAIESKALTRAADYIDFSYAGEAQVAYTYSEGVTGGVTRAFLSFAMSADDIKAFAGNKVTGFSMYGASNENGTANPIRQGRFFYSTDLTKEDYSQNFIMSRDPYGYNEISLDTPYTITGEEKVLMFGYSFIIPTAKAFFIVVDEIENSPEAGLIGISDDDSFPKMWDPYAPYIGALCMSIRIEGDNLPENMASIVAVDTPSYLPLSGNGASVDFAIKNRALNELSSVEVTASVTGMPDIVKTFDFSPIPFGQTTVLTLEGVKANEPAFVDFSMKLTKVNGEAFEGAALTATVPAYEQGYPKKIVAEDATGTWCGWCPGGIEALEYLKTTYPDRAIAIGVHNQDVMAIAEYQKFIEAYVSGFPNVWYNRTISQTPTEIYTNVCDFIDQVAAYFDFPSYANVTLDGTLKDEETVTVTASTEFAIGTTVPHYLSFVIIENGVGPYIQQNYFGQQRVAMNGWEKKSSRVSTVYDDVARYYNSYPGIKGSLPSKIDANSPYDYTLDLPLTAVKGNEYSVVALLTNAATGEIVNATEISMTKDGTTAVDSIEMDAPAEYYNLQGLKVSNPSNGIYLRRQGDTTTKVVIR
ncbi:MAG: hypothetical protein K2N35_05680 [Muribaculaceae bacterium]|nr:hypothetical protein [Muribaculaceae bacterium]